MTPALFHEVYQICTEQHDGAFVPQIAARLIAQRSGLTVDAVLRELTAPVVYLYPDVQPMLDRLFRYAGATPILWTEGELATAQGEPGYQLLKLEASQLLTRYPQWRLRAKRLGLPPVLGGFSKRDALADLASLLKRRSIQSILVVDDNPEQLLAAGAWLSDGRVPFHLLHIDRSEAFGTTLPPSITPIHSLTALGDYVGDYVAGLGTQIVLLDLDYTLIDHAHTREEMAQRIARLCASESDG